MSDIKELFQEFASVNSEDWKAKIIKDLRGADYDEKLLSKTDEGIVIKPFYHSEDLVDYPAISHYRKNNDWEVCQEIRETDDKKANALALDALQRGATGLIFYPNTACQLEVLLKDILVEHIAVHFQLTEHPDSFIQQWNTLVNQRKLDIASLKGSINFDPLALAGIHGNFSQSENEDLQAFTALQQTPVGLTTFCINAERYHNAGATTVEELGIALAHAHEYVHLLGAKNCTTIQWNLAIGPNYFKEIAKLRALRSLWNQIIGSYQLESEQYIHCTTGLRNKTVYDPYVNMLRSTSEAMSAVMGSCDSLSVKAFDTTYKNTNEFGERIARNQQLILKGESYLEKVNDPASGSYYIESLTHQIAEKALAIFKSIEADGGYLQCLKSGKIQSIISAAASREQEAFDKGEKVLLGSNLYPNGEETMANQIELQSQVVASENTILEAIPVRRLTEAYEKERLNSETH